MKVIFIIQLSIVILASVTKSEEKVALLATFKSETDKETNQCRKF